MKVEFFVAAVDTAESLKEVANQRGAQHNRNTRHRASYWSHTYNFAKQHPRDTIISIYASEAHESRSPQQCPL